MKKPMEEVLTRLAPNRESASAVCARPETALHGLADGDVLFLDGAADGDARAVLLRLRSLELGEVEIEDDPRAIDREGDDEVRVHHSLVNVDHEVRIQPEVVRALAAADLRDRLVDARLHRARLQAPSLAVLDRVLGKLERARESAMKVRHVIAAVEVVIDE